MDQMINELNTLLKDPTPGDSMSQERVSVSGDSMSRTPTTTPGDLMSQEWTPTAVTGQNTAHHGVTGGGKAKCHTVRGGAEKRRLKKLLARGVEYARAAEICKQPLSSPRQGATSDPVRATEGAKNKRAQKRDRSEEISLKDNPRKSTKLETARPSFKEVISSIKVGIKAEDKVLSDSELGLLRASILRRIDVEAAKGGDGPTFLNCSQRDGWLCITCADENSRNWLLDRINLFRPWEGAKLAAMLEKDFPKPYIGTIWVPGPPEDPKTLLNRIKFQTKRYMDCSGWRLMNSSRVKNGQSITFCMPQASCEELQKNGMKVWMSFNPIAVRVKIPKTPGTSAVPMEQNELNVPPIAPPEGQPPPNPSATVERRPAPSTTPFCSGNADVFDPQIPGPSRATEPAKDIAAAPSTSEKAQAGPREPTIAPRPQGDRGQVGGATIGPADFRLRPPLGRQGPGKVPGGTCQQHTKSSKPQRGAMRRGRGRGAFKVPTARKPTQ